ncbi:unnamed protein product [Didymodactylos carnosus]|uniref:Uncharacterized protein n=1 Tax=Didymodactylos carnosus TaxID=1234261 RepID=A0A815YEI4_9BILA|nr:unnamed protein product [Didymodactylos carnosus]CAF1569710.1 unnamed protein product [Didymodactylos carnosus]CAF3584544.1 unnamed protein product [Didymodactylos carnosus]CAF4432775.1 unnamed protein product [Didymodactylos carnosus]
MDAARYADMFADNVYVLEGGIYDHEDDLLHRLANDIKIYLMKNIDIHKQKAEDCKAHADEIVRELGQMRREQYTYYYNRHTNEEEPVGAPPSD